MKAIYQPKGKAGEYAKYACNFYVGCSNDCEYCYCKRGVLGHAMGKPQVSLKKCFKNEHDAYKSFVRELHANLDEYRKHGIFFTFTSDPMLPETQDLNNAAVLYAVSNGVPCKILTKRADFDIPASFLEHTDRIAYGFTLTGCDELERNASTNTERIERMADLHRRGFKIFASIEPIININDSGEMIRRTLGFCDLYKIGLLSGHKNYTRYEVVGFVDIINAKILNYDHGYTKVYWKDSVLDFVKRDRRSDLFRNYFCVGADYNIFNQ